MNIGKKLSQGERAFCRFFQGIASMDDYYLLPFNGGTFLLEIKFSIREYLHECSHIIL